MLTRIGLIAVVVVLTACHEEYGIGPSTADRVEVESFTFSGVEAIDESALRDVLATRATPWLPWAEGRYFDRDDFERDLQRIEAFYEHRGYPNAEVRSYDIDLNEQDDTIRLHVSVTEGEPLLVDSIELQNFAPLSPERLEQLREDLPLQPGEPLDREQLVGSAELAAGALKNAGHPWATVETIENQGAGRAEVILRADPGDVAVFGEISIAGNAAVSDEVIRRQLLFRPGERYRLADVRESLRRLYALELFEFVNIEYAGTERRGTEFPTRVTVTEGDHRRLNFSVGYGTEEKGRVDATWRHVNFLGDARTFDVHGKWSWLDRGVEATLVQPYLFTPNYSLSMHGQTWFVDEPAFDARDSGGRAAVTRALGPNALARGHFSYTYQRSQIADEALNDPTLRDELIALGLNPDTGVQDGVLSTLGLSAQLFRVNDTLNPRQGFVLSGEIEQAGGWLPGTYHYVNALADVRGYYTPSERVTLAARVRYGGIDPFGPPSNIPYFKRLFLGGATSLRGWGRFEVAPLSTTGLPVGGQSLFETSAEVRARVWGNLGIVGFVDAGNVWPDAWHLSVDDLLYDVGPGLRYLTPIGPVRFDAAYQLNRLDGLRIDGQPQTRRWRLHFSIGQAF